MLTAKCPLGTSPSAPDLYLPQDTNNTSFPIQRKRQGEQDEEASLPALGGGAKLPEDVQAQMETAFGADFSAVRIHEGPQAAAVGALAYTQGTDIHFQPGQYNPHSQRGRELLGHELAHVIQQSQGRVPTMAQTKGAPINADPTLEREADEMGTRAAREEPIAGQQGNRGSAEENAAGQSSKTNFTEKAQPARSHIPLVAAKMNQTVAKKISASVRLGYSRADNVIQRADVDTTNSAGLKDSKDAVNKHVNKVISDARKNHTNDKAKMLKEIYDKLAADKSPGRSAIELWAEKLPSTHQKMPAESASKYDGVRNDVSIFRQGRLWKQNAFPILNPTLKINGIAVGSDKLGHFFQQGFDYFGISVIKKKETLQPGVLARKQNEEDLAWRQPGSIRMQTSPRISKGWGSGSNCLQIQTLCSI